MRRTLLAVVVAICSIGRTASAQSPLTTVSDTITRPDGSHPSGTAVISWGRFMDDSVPRKSIPPGSKTISIPNGVVSTSLFPTSVTLPPACYKIEYRLANVTSLRYWFVPVSTVAVNLNTVESSVPCSTQGGATVALAQITPSGATIGQVPIFNGSYYAPGNQSGGGGGGSPGGSNGQLQYNLLGAFGGFTPVGDCTIVVPNIVCTKTNGLTFAPSATIDTTNASNLSGGIVPSGRLNGIPNSSLANPSITVATSSPLAGGGAVPLGGTLTLSCPTCGGISTVTLTGDVTGTGAGTVPTSLQNIPAGTPMVSLLATNSSAPVVPPAGKAAIYVDGPSKNLAVEDDAGIIKHGVQTKAVITNNFVTGIDDAGLVTVARPTCGDLSDAMASCSINTTNASNISGGTLPTARLPAINLAASGAGGVTGNIQIVNINGGLNASSSTFLRGDNTWQPISAGGTVTATLGALSAAHLVVGNNGTDITVVPTLGLTTQSLHGNPSGTPTWGLTVLTTDVSGILPFANGGTGTNTNFANHFFFGNSSGGAAAPVAVQPTFADLAAGTVSARGTFAGGNLFIGGVNVQTGTSYALLTTDENKIVTFNNGSAVAVSLSQATTAGFTAGATFDLYNIGAGAVTVTPAASTINGGSTIVLNQGQGARIVSDGTNYSAWVSAAPSGSGTVTSITFVSPLTGGTVTGTGNVGCTICVTSAAALTNIQLLIGSGSQGIHALGSSGTTAQVLHGNGVGDPAYGPVVNADVTSIDAATKLTGITPVANGGWGLATLTAHALYVGNGTSAPVAVAVGTTDKPLVGATGADPVFSKVTLTNPATAATLTIANNKTFTVSNTVTQTATDGSTVAFGAGGTVVYTANDLSVFAATTSAQLRALISDETGSGGAAVFATAPTITSAVMVTPALGVATATSLNGLTITASTGTLTIPNGVVLTGPAASGTVATLGNTNTFTGRQDASGAASTSPMKVGTSVPGTCTVGDLFFKSDATPGQNIYECPTTNNFIQQLNTGGGSVTWQTAGSTTVTGNTVNFSSGFIGSNVGGTYTVVPNTAVTASHDQIHANDNYLSSTNGTTAMTATAPNKALTAYTVGACYDFLTDTDNPASVSIDGLGTILFKTADGTTAPRAGLLKAGQPFTACYNGAGPNFIIKASSSFLQATDGAGSYRGCTFDIGGNNGAALVDGDLGPQESECGMIPYAATLVEVMVRADSGTPNVIIGRDRQGTIANVLSSALATAGSGARSCSNTGGTISLGGTVTCSATLQNTPIVAGDWFKMVSGTAGGTAKSFRVSLIWRL